MYRKREEFMNTVLIKECAWCNPFHPIKNPLRSNNVTHGICQSCFAAEIRKLSKKRRVPAT